MTLNNLIDTLLNVWVFAFIGILVWLYFRREPGEESAKGQGTAEEN
jgi:hypothetical protein